VDAKVCKLEVRSMARRDSSVNVKRLIDAGYVIVTDTNVLLGPYRFSPDQANFALSCLSEVLDAIRIPYMVRKEFDKHKRSLNAARSKLMQSPVEEFKKLVDGQTAKAEREIGQLELRGFPDVALLKGQCEAAYASIASLFEGYFDDRAVLGLIRDDWDADLPDTLVNGIDNLGHVMQPPTFDEILSICEDGARRYKRKIPPGYMDAKDKDGIRKYGDLILWKETLRYAASTGRNVIFVTDDAKEDWWTKTDDGYIFREELVKEFGKETLRACGRSSPLDIIPFPAGVFYEAVAASYGIDQADAVDRALLITSDGYVNNIKDEAFEEIASDLVYSQDDYLDDSITWFGSEGVTSWDIEESDFNEFRLIRRDGDSAVYRLTYSVTMRGTSHDYWGRDDDTKEAVLSPGCEHEIAGMVVVQLNREATITTDFKNDNEFRCAKLFEASFHEVGFIDYGAPDLDEAFWFPGK